MPADVRVFACVPVDEPGARIAGSRRTVALCGHVVWVAPSSLEILADAAGGMVVMCAACCAVLAESHGPDGVDVAPLTDRQRVELEEARRDG